LASSSMSLSWTRLAGAPNPGAAGHRNRGATVPVPEAELAAQRRPRSEMTTAASVAPVVFATRSQPVLR
jgi:hypothetical protein